MKRRRMHRRRHRDPTDIIRRLVGVCFMLALFISGVYGYRELLELVTVYGENRCRNLVTQLVLDTVSQVENTERLYSFTEADNTEVIALNSDAVRQFQTTMGRQLSVSLDALNEQVYPVPVGTIIGGVLLMGRGPLIEIRYIPVGSTQVTVNSRLQDAGVNQVLYQVMLELEIDMTVILPGGAKQICCDQSMVLEEVLISGRVPYVYSG